MCKGAAPAPVSPHAVTAPSTSQRPPCLTWPCVHTLRLPCDPLRATLRGVPPLCGHPFPRVILIPRRDLHQNACKRDAESPWLRTSPAAATKAGRSSVPACRRCGTRPAPPTYGACGMRAAQRRGPARGDAGRPATVVRQCAPQHHALRSSRHSTAVRPEDHQVLILEARQRVPSRHPRPQQNARVPRSVASLHGAQVRWRSPLSATDCACAACYHLLCAALTCGLKSRRHQQSPEQGRIRRLPFSNRSQSWS